MVTVDPDGARAAAREILDELTRAFPDGTPPETGSETIPGGPAGEPAPGGTDPGAGDVPRPLQGVLEWIGDRLATVGEALARIVTAVPPVVWLVLLGALAAGLVWLVVRDRDRAGAAGPAAAGAGPADPDLDDADDADALEARADAAEAAGELALALRLRFRAGLVRLADRGVIDARASVTNTEVRSRLHSERFDHLARRFEEITYGGRAATPPDLEGARREWPRVGEEAATR